MSKQPPQLPPVDWKLTTLGRVSECILGGTPSTEVPQFWGGDIPWMASGDVHIRRIHDVPGRITALGLRSSNATLTCPPAVAVGLAGQGKTRGTVALTLCTLSTNQSIALLRANGIDLRTDYLFHNLDWRYEELRARSSGGGRGGLSKAILEAVPILLPSLAEQSEIVKILDTLDTAISETGALIAKLKAVKQGLLHDLLTRGIDVNGELRPSQAEAPQFYKESPLGWIPKDWEVKQLKELLAAVDPAMRSGPFGSALLKEELVSAGLPFLGIDNVYAERFVADYKRFVTTKKFAQLARYAVRPDDLMITIMGTVGRCCLVPEDVGQALSSKHVWTITLDQELYSPYLAMLQVNYSPWVLEHFGRDQQGGTMAAIRSETLRSTLLPTPPRDEQRLIEERLRAISKRIDLEVDSFVKMQAKKSGLMDDLLTGRVRVKNILAPLVGTSQIDPHSLLLELCQALHQADQRAKDEYKRELFGDAFIPELLVMRKDKVRVEIRKENVSHNAPHLHISHSDKFDASISLKDFSILAGDIDRKVLKHFLKQLVPVKAQLMEIWNELNEQENSRAAEVMISNLKL